MSVTRVEQLVEEAREAFEDLAESTTNHFDIADRSL